MYKVHALARTNILTPTNALRSARQFPILTLHGLWDLSDHFVEECKASRLLLLLLVLVGWLAATLLHLQCVYPLQFHWLRELLAAGGPAVGLPAHRLGYW